jgi:hypothetical protein
MERVRITAVREDPTAESGCLYEIRPTSYVGPWTLQRGTVLAVEPPPKQSNPKGITMLKTEPVALFAAIAVLVVSIASFFGVALDTGLVETLLVNAVLVVTAVASRSKVTPTEG